MGKISYLLEGDLDKYVGLQKVSILNTVSDVSTLIEVYEEAVKEVDFRKIKYVVQDNDIYYYLVISDAEESFDLFSFITESFDGDMVISSINARYLFPKRLSRGIFESSSDYDDADDDIATSYLDEDDLGLIDENKVYNLYQPSSGITIKVDNKGIIMGRSVKKVDYLIKDNGSIGRTHCNVYVDSRGRLMVHDFDSLNGTFVNNRKVHSSEDVEMHEGDVLLLANEEFRVI